MTNAGGLILSYLQVLVVPPTGDLMALFVCVDSHYHPCDVRDAVGLGLGVRKALLVTKSARTKWLTHLIQARLEDFDIKALDAGCHAASLADKEPDAMASRCVQERKHSRDGVGKWQDDTPSRKTRTDS